MSPIELAAAGFGLVNIVLVARRSIWNFGFGAVMVCLYFGVFFEARLYSAAALQIFFLGAQLHGWLSWRRQNHADQPVAVRSLSSQGRLLALAGLGCGIAGLGFGMSHWTNAAAPWWDAANASGSMVAQILTNRRNVESWPGWIAVNLLSVWLYASQGLLATAALYAIFLCIAAWGWDQWRRAAPVIPK